MPATLRALGPDQSNAWRSGAVLAGGAAVAAVVAHVSLRATSEGAAPTPAVLGVAAGLLALLLWPLSARTTRAGSLAALLVVGQLGTQLAVGLATGRPLSLTPAGLTCCPPGAQTRDGFLGTLTAQAGWALFGGQMLACLLLAFAMHGSRRSLDGLATALSLLSAALRPFRVLRPARTLRQFVAPARPAPALVPAAPGRVQRHGLLPVRRRPRRGPPRVVLHGARPAARSGAAVLGTA